MATSVQFRPQNRDLGMVMREVDEEIAIFLGMRNTEKQTDDHLLVDNSDEFDNSTGAEPMPNSLTSIGLQIDQIAADDNLLRLESDKSDFDWLLTLVDTSLLPTSETSGVQDFEATHTDSTNGESISLESEQLAFDQTSVVSNVAKSTNVEFSASKRPSSSGNRKQTSRAATPTRRSSLPAKPKPSRASTPTSRSTIPSKPTAASQARSSTPSKSTSRSSTPSTRASLPTTSSSKPRSSTPTTRKPATPLDQSSAMVRKTGTTVLKIPVVKSRSSKPLELLSISQDATQNPKAVMPKRPASASRERPISTTTTTTTTTTNISSLNGKQRQKSCSPARVRFPNGMAHKSGKLIGLRSRGYNNCGDDDVNPVLMGTQMVERVVNMRKLAPPKLEESLSNDNTKKSSKASGFGRSLSSRSLEMAVRHMDIRRSIADGIRPVATGVLSSSLGVRSCSANSGTLGASDSPVASSDGSESFNSRFGDENEMDGSLNMKC